jgi:type I restriction enzyme S subunit
MAKRKLKAGKQVLSEGELLAQALVPEDEQPYPIPENWVWVKVICLVDLHRGVTYPQNAAHSEKSEDDCLIMRGGNIEDNNLNFHNNIYVNNSLVKSNQIIKKNDIIIVSSTGSYKVIGRAGISSNDYSDVAFGAFLTLVRPRDDFCKRLIALFFQTEGYRNTMRILAKGVNINNIKNEYIQNIPFPLPPLAEQQRIVERIESMFEKLDHAKESILTAKDNFEICRATILHKAFSGELTAKWRKKNGVGMESWAESTLGKCGQWFGGGTPNTNVSDYWEDGTIPWVTPKDMKAITIIDTIDKITIKAVNESTASLIHKPAVLFVMRSGILRRLLPIGITTQKVTVNQDMKAVIPYNDILLEYLCWLCISRERDIREKCSKSGTTVESINTESLYAYKVNIPTFPEQQEIIRILDSLLEKKQHARELCDVIEKIDIMKKAILARAFRGMLGTNKLSEESAVGLLLPNHTHRKGVNTN